jgi:hypothetical protein
MEPDSLQPELERLNRSEGFCYRAMLAGLLAVHGRDAVVEGLIASCSGNVISIAAAPGWCRPPGTEGDGHGCRVSTW